MGYLGQEFFISFFYVQRLLAKEEQLTALQKERTELQREMTELQIQKTELEKRLTKLQEGKCISLSSCWVGANERTQLSTAKSIHLVSCLLRCLYFRESAFLGVLIICFSACSLNCESNALVFVFACRKLEGLCHWETSQSILNVCIKSFHIKQQSNRKTNIGEQCG